MGEDTGKTSTFLTPVDPIVPNESWVRVKSFPLGPTRCVDLCFSPAFTNHSLQTGLREK